MPNNPSHKLTINDIEVDFNALKLCINDVWQPIEARQLGLLKLLLDHHGQAVSRQQIMDHLWQDTIVSDNSVSQAVTQLRRTLGDDKGTPQFIRTVPRVGYQLIADIKQQATEPQPPQPNLAQLSQSKPGISLIASTALLAVTLTLMVLNWLNPELTVPQYQYAARLTSMPGAESFLRYSPKGRYLAFNQSSENRQNLDLAVYDSQTQSIHPIRSTGYSEQAPEWSPDGRWLAYYRHDPLSCGIRVMGVSNPVETWRLSPDFHLYDCKMGFNRQKIHWLDSTTLYISSWLDQQPVLTRLELNPQGRPRVKQVTHYPQLQPQLMDIDKTSKQLLIVEKHQAKFQLSLVDLNQLQPAQQPERKLIEHNRQHYWGVKWHQSGQSFWLGNQNLRLVATNGASQVITMPPGYIADIDVNPNTGQLAHTEGSLNVNLYTLSMNQTQSYQAKRLSSSTRTDILPALSHDGQQTVFISYQNHSQDGGKNREVWLKHRHRQAASLLTKLDESIEPKYLLWSPNGENILLGDSQQNLHLINTINKHLITIVPDHQGISAVNWSADGKQISFNAEQQSWRYDIQLGTTQKYHAQESNIRLQNPSYPDHAQTVARYLRKALGDQRPADDLSPSFALYQPAIIRSGIYYIIHQGHQLKLFFYQFETQQNHYLTDIGFYQQEVKLDLSLSAAQDGSELVYSKVEAIETDILLQRVVESE